MKVENFYNKNQFIIRGEGKTIFQSYQSEIAEISKDGKLTLGIDWDYSITTLKHLYLFLNDYIQLLNNEIQKYIRELSTKRNKKLYIQKLINNDIIKYNEKMQ